MTDVEDRLLLILLGFDASNGILSGYAAAKQFIEAQPPDAIAAFKQQHPEGWTTEEHLAAAALAPHPARKEE